MPQHSTLVGLCRFSLFLLLLALIPACTMIDQVVPSNRIHNITLQPNDLETHGLAMLTPSTVTGQEEDRQALALIFTSVLQERRPNIRVVPLADTLGEINRAGLESQYRQMFDDYRFTSIFNRDTLKAVGVAAQARYLAQLKLANFRQDASGRLSILGLRLVQTKASNIRLFLTIWDSSDGSIAWEGIQELSYSYDTTREKPITFKLVVEESSKYLIRDLP